MMADKPYGQLGAVLDEIARRRNVRGPYRLGRYIVEQTGEGPGGSHWSQIYYGQKDPSPKAMKRFALAMDLTKGEEEKLATAYLFRRVAAAA